MDKIGAGIVYDYFSTGSVWCRGDSGTGAAELNADVREDRLREAAEDPDGFMRWAALYSHIYNLQ